MVSSPRSPRWHAVSSGRCEASCPLGLRVVECERRSGSWASPRLWSRPLAASAVTVVDTVPGDTGISADTAALTRARESVIAPLREAEVDRLDVAHPATPFAVATRAGTRQPQHTMGEHVKKRADFDEPFDRLGPVELAAPA